MFSVSPYAFHPLIQRFVRLWRYVQVVSDMITFVLSMICCQCGDVMPLSTSGSADTKPSVQIFDVSLKLLTFKFRVNEPPTTVTGAGRCPVYVAHYTYLFCIKAAYILFFILVN